VKTVFVDVDTQIDFLFPAGALHVPGAEGLIPVLARLNHHAAARSVPVLSTLDAHAENDPEFTVWPPHCVVGTAGQRKPEQTLLDRRVLIPSTPADFSIDGLSQILLNTQAIDCFTNPNLPSLLERLEADRYVVYGVATEYCMRCASLGLLRTSKRVELVTDAIKGLRQDDAGRILSEFTSGGGHLTTSAEVCA